MTILRNLNDYESMLATMTCNVAMSLSIEHGRDDLDSCLRQAWSQCVAERMLLQVKLEPTSMGPLGERYTLEAITVDPKTLFCIRHVEDMPDMVRQLQRVGTTALDISKGSYFVDCVVKQESDKISMQVILSLCHSLSDGPGALRVARSFLQHLGHVLDGTENVSRDPQPLTDLQALILGSDYGATRQPDHGIFEGQDAFVSALSKKPMMIDNARVLPPEAMQDLPHDDAFGGSSCVGCVHFTLTADETSALRALCRLHETTIQGALTAAAIKTRIELLGFDMNIDTFAAVQVPVNTRTLANVDPDECLCGSAGVWHLTRLRPSEHLIDTARYSTQSVRRALQNNDQPREWLYRLFHAPATLPPYSLMVSSIGVAPIEPSYGSVNVERLYFFGGALRNGNPSRAQSSMIHAVTFRDELTCMINFTSPGVAKSFANDMARLLKATLLWMVAGEAPDSWSELSTLSSRK